MKDRALLLGHFHYSYKVSRIVFLPLSEANRG